MSMNRLLNSKNRDFFTSLGHKLTIDDWIFQDIPCVLLYKDGLMDIYPVQEYTAYELTMLQRDPSYKSSWVPIRYGSFLEMQACMYEILQEGLHALSTKPPELAGNNHADATICYKSL
jgi:hypothetical protein